MNSMGTAGIDPAVADQASALARAVAAAQQSYNEAMGVGFEQSCQKYAQAQQAYSAELQQLYAELAERSQKAYQAYGEAQKNAYTSAPSFEAYNAECRGYLERLQQLFGNSELQHRTQAAYKRYAERAVGSPLAGDDPGEALRRELDDIWQQQALRQDLKASQERYVGLLEKLNAEVQERQAQAYRELLEALGEIWARPELAARTQDALNRFAGTVREVVIECHATVEKSSAAAARALASREA